VSWLLPVFKSRFISLRSGTNLLLPSLPSRVFFDADNHGDGITASVGALTVWSDKHIIVAGCYRSHVYIVRNMLHL
jgi:hypothetical protein